MFGSQRKNITVDKTKRLHTAIKAVFEPLENRQLLSASCGGGSFGGSGSGFGGASTNSITFNLAPTAVQTGLDSLAATNNLTDPTATTAVDLNNVNGIETYSVTLDGTGTVSTLTVNPLGDSVNAPTHSTTTWATLSGTGTGSDSAAATEITKIAAALDLTAPVSTETVDVDTTSAGTTTYSVQLSSANTSSGFIWGSFGGSKITVDSAGNPVDDQQLPFSVFSTAIQNALNANKPAAATALASTSTQNVSVLTSGGVTTYSTSFTTAGTYTTVTVNAAGTLTSLPVTAITTFSTLPSSLQTELQTLATADGATTAIAATQSVVKETESNDTVLYSVSLGNTADASGDSIYSFGLTVTVDSNGNPTTLTDTGLGFGDQGFGSPGGPGGQGLGGSGWNGWLNGPYGNGANSSTGTVTNASSGTVAVPISGTVTAADQVAITPTLIASQIIFGGLNTSLLSTINSLDGQLASLGKYLVPFVITKAGTVIEADGLSLVESVSKLTSDSKALTKNEKATLKADDKAILSAVKAVNKTLTTQDVTLKSDVNSYLAKFKADQKVINKDKKNATALATAKAQLTSDESAGFTLVAGDLTSIETSIESNSGVTTAQAKLSSDLPTIATDQTTIVTGANQLVSAIDSQLAAG